MFPPIYLWFPVLVGVVAILVVWLFPGREKRYFFDLPDGGFVEVSKADFESNRLRRLKELQAGPGFRYYRENEGV